MQRRATPEDAGARLDAFLAAPLGSRARAQRLIEAGLVLVDGRAAPKRHLLSAGELVTVDEPAQAPAPDAPDAPYAVPYRDEHLLVVDKPAGVVVHPARGHRTGTLAQALSGVAAGGEDVARAGIVHLRAALQARAITREYLALVEGRPPARSGTIDAPLGRDRRVRTRMSTDSDDPRAAVTHFEIERALPRTTLLRVRLQTGRTHQIRAHLRAIEHPVVGDPEYGTKGRLGLERQFLHAARLAFAHPVTGAPVDVSSPLPDDLRAALDRAAAE